MSYPTPERSGISLAIPVSSQSSQQKIRDCKAYGTEAHGDAEAADVCSPGRPGVSGHARGAQCLLLLLLVLLLQLLLSW
ncbi:Tpr And Ankyrin Repeat-Containing Protein 1 [Manis pentadactyla]|nr:Tpr And Ankyrin Repeat-Containing Protein 1 [Manis pentadactyla]